MQPKDNICVACEGEAIPLTPQEIEQHLRALPGWKHERATIKKDYTFANFKDAIAFVNTVAAIAEEEGHHPDIMIWYRVVTIVLTTHALSALSLNDIVLAKKIDATVSASLRGA